MVKEEHLTNQSAKTKKPATSSITKLWLFLVLLRITVNLIGQRGYIHPDEFFQGPEIIAGDLFECKDRILRTWEFTLDYFANGTVKQGPIRNIAIPYLFYGLPMLVLKYLASIGSITDFTIDGGNFAKQSLDTLISVDAKTLIYYPRLFMALSSLLIDLCLFKLAILCHLNTSSVLLMFASSYISIVFLTRTFSNSIETMLFAVLVYLVVKSIKAQFTQKEWIESLKAEIRPNQANKKTDYGFDFVDKSRNNYLGKQIGFIFCIGVFNRPTFIIFSIVPLAYWIFLDVEKCDSFKKGASISLNRLLELSKLLLPAALILVLIDTAYFYELRSLDDLLIHICERKLIFTPYNFFKYNSDPSNLAQHGSHPAYQHLINCFLLFGFTVPIFAFESIKSISNLISTLFRTKVDEDEDDVSLESVVTRLWARFINETTRGLFTLSVLVPLLFFSLVDHKEPRFLLPLLIPVCLLTSERFFARPSYSATTMRLGWFLFNLIGVVVFGYMHQGGVIPAVTYTQKMFTHVSNLDIDQHVIFYHTYMPPRYLLEAPLSANLIMNNRYKYEMKKQEDDLKSVHRSNNNQQQHSMPERKIYDLMSSGDRASLDELIKSIKNLYIDPNSGFIRKNFAVFLVAPEVADLELNGNRTCRDDLNDKTSLVFEVITKFRVHITFEHLKEHFDYINCRLDDDFKKKYGEKDTRCYLDECEKKDTFQRVFDSFSLNFYQLLI